MKLSRTRAEAVPNYLVGRGIAANLISAKGYGPENPVETNSPPEGRQLNRRTEFYRIK